MEEYKGKILTIMLCSSCNANCKHCYISYKNNFDEKTLDELLSNFKGEKISLNGTEPLLFPKYFKYFQKVGQDFVFTNSNVIIKNPEILDEIKKYGIKKICISYHYKSQHLYNDISFEQVEKCIKICQDKDLKVRLLCSVCKENFKNLEELCEKALSLNVHEILLTNFIVQGNAIKNNLDYLALNEEEILYTLTEINRLRNKYGKETLFIDRCGSFGNCIGSKHYLCDAGIDDVTITPDLKLYPCLFFAGVKEFEIGYYENGKFMITKNCTHDCSNCLAKRMFNYHEKCDFIKNI